jgi:hypothetical protein
MRRAWLGLCFLAIPAPAKITWTTAAAVSTIAVNVLDIKTTVSKAVKAAKAVKKGTVKVVRKVKGK